MNIKDYVKESFQFNSDKAVEYNISLATAQPEVTFWGGRVIRIDGYEGTIDLDKYAERICISARCRCQIQDLIPFTAKHRAAGVEMIKKTREFYKVIDTKLSQANWFTKLCYWARSFFTTPFPREKIEHPDAIMYFTAFPAFIFDSEFGQSPVNPDTLQPRPEVVATVVSDRDFGSRYVPVSRLLDPYLAQGAAAAE